MEINASAPQRTTRVIHRLWDDWNEGRRYFLSAGTDTHDVWNEESGAFSDFAIPTAALTAASFAEALKAGPRVRVARTLIFPPSCSAIASKPARAGPRVGRRFAVDRRFEAHRADRRRSGG